MLYPGFGCGHPSELPVTSSSNGIRPLRTNELKLNIVDPFSRAPFTFDLRSY
jgi:hypothetical protein